MTDAVLLYEVKDEIAFITLNRPEKLNAINGPLADALKDAWVTFEADAAAKVAILSGSGTSFSAGRDISPGAVDPTVPFQTHQALPQNGIKVFKPIVGAIQGYALGAGYNFAVQSCDITIAAEGALFGYPEARAGIPLPPPDYQPYMAFKPSLEFLLLGWKGANLLSAERAYQLGLVNAVVSEEQLLAEAIRWAEMLKKIPPLYIKSVKAGYYKAVRTTMRKHESEYLEYVWPQEQSKDLAEARAAFKERREPQFHGE